MSLIIIERGIPMPLPSLDKGDVPVYGICLYIENIYKNKRMRLCPNRCANSAANACVR